MLKIFSLKICRKGLIKIIGTILIYNNFFPFIKIGFGVSRYISSKNKYEKLYVPTKPALKHKSIFFIVKHFTGFMINPMKFYNLFLI